MLIQLHVEKQPRQKSHTNLGPTLAVKGQSMKWRAEVCADKVQMVGSQQFGRTRGTVEMYDGHGRTDDVRCDLWSHSGLNSDSVCCWEGAPGLVCRTWPADGARSNQRSKKKGSYCHMWRMQTGSVLHQTDEKTTWRQRGILRHWGQVADAEKNKTKLNVIGERSDSEGSGAAATEMMWRWGAATSRSQWSHLLIQLPSSGLKSTRCTLPDTSSFFNISFVTFQISVAAKVDWR